MGRLALLLLLIAMAIAPLRAADDDFTDIPDIDPVKPSPKPKVAPAKPKGQPPRKPSAPAGLAKDLIRRYTAARHEAFLERTYTLAVCGGNLWGGDSRRSHAHLDDGDTWLARGDALWWKAQRTGDRTGMALAMRHLHAAHEAYLAARVPPPLSYTWQDSPKPRPFPSAYPSEPHPGPGMGQVREEPNPQWRRHDVLPLEESSPFEEDPHW